MLKDTPPSGVVFFLNSVFQNFSICVIALGVRVISSSK